MVGDEGAVSISHYLHALPRIASLNLSHNCITETGSIALAETVGGNLMAALPGHHEGTCSFLKLKFQVLRIHFHFLV